MSLWNYVGEIVELRRNDREFSCQWKIYDFFSLSNEPGHRYSSPAFEFCNGSWKLAVHPSGTLQSSKDGFVTLFLFKENSHPAETFNITAGIMGTGGVENQIEKRQEFFRNDVACCWLGFSRVSELREHQSRLVPGNILTITCNIKSVVLPVARDVSSQTDGLFNKVEVPIEENKSPEKLGIDKLSEDIGKLLVSRDDGDVTVQVGDTEFKVYKLILSARCPVLSAMLEHDTSEKASNRICIRDCKADIFKDFLQYLYKGSVESLGQQNAFGLYRIADMYLADDLKLQCRKYIQDTLCIETFSDTAKLALTHGESSLLQQAVHFASQNLPIIIRSIEWQNFIREFPIEANEIIIKCIRLLS